MGLARYSTARHLVITADGGGSIGSRVQWNKIEHRLFSFITQNWRGRPLDTHQVIVALIAATKTKAGLTVRSEIDPNLYPAGVKVTDQEMATINIRRHDFHGEWNYTIAPRTKH